MKTDEIRHRYLDYFKQQQHKEVASDSLIPQNDPTLLFTGAGMNQFKEYFLGLKKDFSRATSSQKCLRTGDLDNVGRTAYHHTFFEMLGNFSFGDYFKKDAIVWAWSFLVGELMIPASKLRVSVHRDDDESYAIWAETVGLASDVIYRFGDKDNFWPSNAPTDGPNGPCGPCSEIFFDQGADRGCRKDTCSPACDCGRFAEIWNLVFTQFERKDGGELVPLPNKNIDTGMGLERIACVMQGKYTNFDIDIFVDILSKIRTVAHIDTADVKEEQKSSMYAIADHVRACVFCISDGAYPSNEGRGYVVRKLIRRSVWHARLLGIHEAFLSDLIPVVIDVYKAAYPELEEHMSHVIETVKVEEERFLKTLEGGIKLLNELLSAAKDTGIKKLLGEDTFRLYDTFGFPLELTRIIAEKENVGIDEEGFEKKMTEQREKAKNATQISDAIFSSTDFEKYLLAQQKTIFTGYEALETESRIVSMFSVDKEIDRASEGAQVIVVFDRSPFYAESGGQVGDIGECSNDDVVVAITAVNKKDDVFYHEAYVKRGELTVDMTVTAKVDSARRTAIAKNHSATHVLQQVLRDVLGPQVRQLGSYVNEEKLRFDFSYPKALTSEQKREIDTKVNEQIQKRLPVQVRETSVQEAREQGALAFFGDRYGDAVRLVTMGDFSKELCGGTHVGNTGDIVDFCIVSEGSVASGIRRIEALTDEHAREYHAKQEAKSAIEEKRKTEKAMVEELEKQTLNEYKQKNFIDAIIEAHVSVGTYSFMYHLFSDLDQGALREIFDVLKQRVKNTIVVLGSTKGEKLSVVVAMTSDITDSSISAQAIVSRLNAEINGRGGGKQHIAFSGTSSLEHVHTLKSSVIEIIKEQLGI